MSGAKSVVVLLAMATFVVATVAAISYPAQAQTPPFDVTCDPDPAMGDVICEGASGDAVGETFNCDTSGTAVEGERRSCTTLSNGNTFSCIVREVDEATSIPTLLTCDILIEPPSGNGDASVSDGGGGGGATPLTQEGEQESEAGEIDQSFDVS
jgi:hypothetical protein